MKKKSVINTFLMAQLLFWGVFSLILSSTPGSFQNVTTTSKSINPKPSAVDFSNITLISDGFGGTYWNDAISYNPAVAVDSSNTVHVVWWDYTVGPWGTDSEIMYANYTIATGWSNATIISDGFGGVYWNDGNSLNPAVAVDGSNTVHVVWYDFTNGGWGTDSEIMHAEFTIATGWSNATIISDGFGGVYWNDGDSQFPAVAVDSSNTVHVVWHDYTDSVWGTDIEIMYTNYTIATGWSNATVISDGFGGVYWNDGISFDATLAIDGDNAVHVVWHDYTVGPWGTDAEIMSAKHTTAMGWSNATIISDGQNGIYWNDGSSRDAAIAIDGDNVVHVVWIDDTNGAWGTDREIMYAKFPTATGWSLPLVISDGHNNIFWNDGASNDPEIVVDGNNVIHVVWEDQTDDGWGTDSEIMYTEFTTVTGWSLPLVISDGYSGDYWNDGASAAPSIAAGTTAVHVVWNDDTVGPWGTDDEIMYTSITIPVPAPVVDSTQGIPFGNFYLLFIFVGIIGIIIYIKRKV
jgi:hypothetical protein